MPTYEYACRDCGQHIEVVQSMSDAPLTTCGACGGALRKVFHPAGIMFRGSGFYATDNRKGASSAAKKLEGASAAEIKAEGKKAAEKAAGSPAKSDAAPAKEKSA
jgi:putative FmdB family regulatory protein